MTEKSNSWSVPVGKVKLITVFSDTKQIISFSPNLLADVTIDVTITENTEPKEV